MQLQDKDSEVWGNQEYWQTCKSSDLFYFVECAVPGSLRDLGVHQESLIISWMMWSSELKACHADLCVFYAARLRFFACCRRYSEIV